MPILRAGPSMDRWPARFHLRWQAPAFGAMAVTAGLAAIAPLASLIVLAFGETGDLWTHLARYVIPAALARTALLLAGVAMVTIIIGGSTAWLVTTFAFPGRDALSWLLPLPLAIPTYIVAYVYVDILDALGPVQSALRAVFGWHSAADYWFPNVRSLSGAILLFGFYSIHTFISPRARCFRLRARYSPSPRACSARDHGNSCGASLCRWRGPQ
jgi:ABC-type Fe3+ transport system permease subunit